MSSVIISTVRNEAPFLLEWIAYHKVIGFDRFVIFSNDCNDGTFELLSSLAKCNEIVHIDHKPLENQKIAERVGQITLERELLRDGEWVMWLDADEFLNIHVGDGRVDDLITSVEGARGMCISWRLFGDASQTGFGGRFIEEPFVRCAEPGVGWQNVKTFFEMGEDVVELFQHKPIMSPDFWQSGGFFKSSSGATISEQGGYMNAWRQGKKRGKIEEAEAGWQVAQVNHYAVRTPDLFKEKQSRGRIGEPNSGKKRYTGRYYYGMNRNEDEDSSILKWSQKTGTEIERLERCLSAICDAGSASLYVEKTHKPLSKGSQDMKPVDQTGSKRDGIYKKMHASHHSEIEERVHSNARLAQEITTLIKPKTVIDIGCGIGLLIKHLRDEGAEVTGVEGPWLSGEAMVLPSENYVICDLEKSIDVSRRFDLCCTIEVAEHLEPGRADSFVSELCRLSDAIVFSAAVPGQGGKDHKNEQWQEYWCLKFEQNGYKTYDPFRGNLRKDPNVLSWFQQNVLLFLVDEHPLSKKMEGEAILPSQANMILPTFHEKVINKMRRRFKRQFGK